VIREGPPISVRPSRQGAPHVPVQKFTRWGGHFERRVRSRVCSGGGFCPLGSRPIATVKENGGREMMRG
jgi:hypothetical protein